jgi:hypothetical protein
VATQPCDVNTYDDSQYNQLGPDSGWIPITSPFTFVDVRQNGVLAYLQPEEVGLLPFRVDSATARRSHELLRRSGIHLESNICSIS